MEDFENDMTYTWVSIAVRFPEEGCVSRSCCSRKLVLYKQMGSTQEVYTECLVRRSLGDASTLSKGEEPFRDIVGGWIRDEESGPRSPSGSRACDAASFTRVTIADLKPHLLEEVWGCINTFRS